jgi:hypothetical protein
MWSGNASVANHSSALHFSGSRLVGFPGHVRTVSAQNLQLITVDDDNICARSYFGCQSTTLRRKHR